MPVEAHVQIGQRSFFRYITQPIQNDSFRRAFQDSNPHRGPEHDNEPRTTIFADGTRRQRDLWCRRLTLAQTGPEPESRWRPRQLVVPLVRASGHRRTAWSACSKQVEAKMKEQQATVPDAAPAATAAAPSVPGAFASA